MCSFWLYYDRFTINIRNFYTSLELCIKCSLLFWTLNWLDATNIIDCVYDRFTIKIRMIEVVQHLVSLLCTSLWELNVQQIIPLHSHAVHITIWITLRCVLVWICAILSRTKIVLWMKYVLRLGCPLAICSHEGIKGQSLTHPRYKNLINLIQFS